MPVFVFALLPIMTVVTAGVAVLGLSRGDNELAGLAALHMAALALANVACWFAL